MKYYEANPQMSIEGLTNCGVELNVLQTIIQNHVRISKWVMPLNKNEADHEV